MLSFLKASFITNTFSLLIIIFVLYVKFPIRLLWISFYITSFLISFAINSLICGENLLVSTSYFACPLMEWNNLVSDFMQQNFWNILLFASSLSIWLQRNEVVFSQNSFDNHKAFFDIIFWVIIWFKLSFSSFL